MLVCVFQYPFCTRDRGCSAHPAFPAPSKAREIFQRLGRSASRGRKCFSAVIACDKREAFAQGSNPASFLFRKKLDCFAEPVITTRAPLRSSVGGALRRPGGSQ